MALTSALGWTFISAALLLGVLAGLRQSLETLAGRPTPADARIAEGCVFEDSHIWDDPGYALVTVLSCWDYHGNLHVVSPEPHR